MSASTWSVADSDRLTAEQVVRDGHHMNGNTLDASELVAILLEAHRREVPRSVVANRIGWKLSRLYDWAVRNGCYLSEQGFGRGPLAWCTKTYAEDQMRKSAAKRGKRLRPMVNGR